MAVVVISDTCGGASGADHMESNNEWNLDGGTFHATPNHQYVRLIHNVASKEWMLLHTKTWETRSLDNQSDDIRYPFELFLDKQSGNAFIHMANDASPLW